MSIYHIPALLNESVDGLNIKPEGIYVDATYGGGGHSKEILKRLNNGKLIAFDQDIDALENIIEDSRLLFVRHNFKFIKNFLRYFGEKQIDGIIADLGVSSHHFDSEQRGFSFRTNGPLDMRMNQNSKLTAETILNTYSAEKLATLFKEFGEIDKPYQLAKNIEKFRTDYELRTIYQLLDAISNCIPKHEQNKYLAKVFQSIRIEVNKETEVLKNFLMNTKELLKKEGRLVVITYHSIEDRIVKNFVQKGKFEGEVEKDFYGNIITPFEMINKKVITPSIEEMTNNPRVRSAKLRIAKKT